MFGRLPRLHRFVLFTLSAFAGAGLGAWISHWPTRGAGLAPGLDVVPLVAGAAVGLMVAAWLVGEPHEPRRVPVERNRRR